MSALLGIIVNATAVSLGTQDAPDDVGAHLEVFQAKPNPTQAQAKVNTMENKEIFLALCTYVCRSSCSAKATGIVPGSGAYRWLFTCGVFSAGCCRLPRSTASISAG